MTNRDATALVLRLVGFYWLVTGTIEAVATAGSFTFATTQDLEWMHKPAFMALTMLISAAIPVVGAALLYNAVRLANRWTSKPDEPALNVVSLGTGTVLLGIYFLVLGVIQFVEPARTWIALRQFQSYAVTTLIEAVIYLLAGGILVSQPRWFTTMLSSRFGHGNVEPQS